MMSRFAVEKHKTQYCLHSKSLLAWDTAQYYPCSFLTYSFIGLWEKQSNIVVWNSTLWHEQLLPRFCSWHLPAWRLSQCNPRTSLLGHSCGFRKGLNHQIRKNASYVLKKHPHTPFWGNNVLETVGHFNYLGSTITRWNNITKKIKKRSAKATIALKRLFDFWKSNSISKNLKAKLH